ncbi:MAG TPA: NAD(P)/FAD-dependent oxidoreductase [Candidatus Limnocylindrales bacterium]|nr:NAD(P)/FAD-dependent oxidoreductase [Candidatus Limnocylindrales bacterium]
MVYDVLIIGGGVVGCAAAYELSRYHLRVMLVERAADVGSGTSKANSGIIHGGHHSKAGTLRGDLEWEGNQCWGPLVEALHIGFRRPGELVVALEEAERPILEHLLAQGRDRGVTGLEIWGAERIRREEPAVTDQALAALHAPTTGVINPYEACFALAACARENGVQFALEHTVTALAQEDGEWVVETDRGPLRASFVINAAGVYAGKIAEMAGLHTFTIRPRKGEEYLLDKRVAGLVQHVIFPCPSPTTKGILVIPTADGTIMLGPTAHQVGTGEDLDTTASGAAEIFAGAQRLVPGVSERDCIAEFAGLRAVANTEDFIIGVTGLAGFLNAAGIQSPGLTAAPAIATRIAQALAGEGLVLRPKALFVSTRPEPLRWAARTVAEQQALAQADPRCARIICRCELVSEREVLDAIADGAGTLDGIKLRTRAGMGRCQGGFCSWRCLELLARETGLPLTALTKRGGGSWLVCERVEASEEALS